jgi:hypothetical protein
MMCKPLGNMGLQFAHTYISVGWLLEIETETQMLSGVVLRIHMFTDLQNQRTRSYT